MRRAGATRDAGLTGAVTAAAGVDKGYVVTDCLAHHRTTGEHIDLMHRSIEPDAGNVWHVSLPETAASVTQSYS
jgi:hypothetical protein